MALRKVLQVGHRDELFLARSARVGVWNHLPFPQARPVEDVQRVVVEAQYAGRQHDFRPCPADGKPDLGNGTRRRFYDCYNDC